MLIAWLKLRQRNLAPILDANGWAINGRVRVPVSLGRSLTAVAKLPPGTLPAMDDKFAEPPVFWPKLVVAAIVIGGCTINAKIGAGGMTQVVEGVRHPDTWYDLASCCAK